MTTVDTMADPDTSTIGIVLADDHPVVRHGLRLLLDEEPDFAVLAEAGDVEEARRYMLGHRPRVLVLDLNMPGQSSREGSGARLRSPRPPSRRGSRPPPRPPR